MRRIVIVMVVSMILILSGCGSVYVPEQINLNGAGYITANGCTSEVKAKTIANDMKKTISMGGYYYFSKLNEDGKDTLYEANQSDNTQSVVSIDGNKVLLYPNPYAFTYQSNIYLFLFSPTQANNISTLKVYKRISNSNGITEFVSSSFFDTSAITKEFTNSSVYFDLCTPCFNNGTLYFTVVKNTTTDGSGIVTCRLYKSVLNSNRFDTPTEVKGNLITQYGSCWLGNLRISSDGSTAYFTFLNNYISSDMAGINITTSMANGSSATYLMPFVASCDIDTNGEFGNNQIKILDSSVNSSEMNFLSDVSFDGTNDILYVCHLPVSVIDLINQTSPVQYGRDGYVLDSLGRSLESMPKWGDFGTIESVVISD